MMASCISCRFWASSNPNDAQPDDPADNDGWCHRYPPVVLFYSDGSDRHGEHPVTNGDHWCGEYQLGEFGAHDGKRGC